MKWLLPLLLLPLLASGCASQAAYDSYAINSAMIAADYYKAAEKPLVSMTLPAPGGGEYTFVVNREVDPFPIGQIKDSEWVAPVQGLINAGLMVGGAAVLVGGAGSRDETVGGDKVNGAKTETTTTTTTEIVSPDESSTQDMVF